MNPMGRIVIFGRDYDVFHGDLRRGRADTIQLHASASRINSRVAVSILFHIHRDGDELSAMPIPA